MILYVKLYTLLMLSGEWHSPVAHLLWEQRAAGSNPVFPTNVLEHTLYQFMVFKALALKLQFARDALLFD